MLHMLQVFQRHVASVCSNCFICFQTYVASVLIWMLHMFSHIYCNSMLQKCFICFSRLLQQVFSCFKLHVFYMDVVYVFTHMLQVYVPNVLPVFQMCYLFQTYVASVLFGYYICCSGYTHIL
jgi:hypothetical protein